MIKKFKSIKNLAVFQSFDWDASVTDSSGEIRNLKEVNIIYGRNYSGKTTLSRIIRALETGELSDKYSSPEFELEIDGVGIVSQDNLDSHGKKIRVFNEDFVKANLRFISDPDGEIKPFAILGAKNNEIERAINEALAELGSNDAGGETGLYLKFSETQAKVEEASKKVRDAAKNLSGQLRQKASGSPSGIRYQSQKFGDQNYNVAKLENDLNEVLKDNHQALSKTDKERLEEIVKEDVKPVIPPLPEFQSKFEENINLTRGLVERTVGDSERIEQLVKDAALHRWVNEGRGHHKDKLDNCAFCGSKIIESRWEQLDKHFDEESERLEKDIQSLIIKLETEKSSVYKVFSPNKGAFYSYFLTKIDELNDSWVENCERYCDSVDQLIELLKARSNSILDPIEFKAPTNVDSHFSEIHDEYEKWRVRSNDYTERLDENKKHAQYLLRLQEVFEFAETINYSVQKANLAELAGNLEEAEKLNGDAANAIKTKIEFIEGKRRELNDEEAGALKVNEYLNDFFGHSFLQLQAIEVPDEVGKRIRFDIIRDGQKAYHLSEGECSLVAFCYFMAKLEDVETKDSKPIIWIDDPISSLDSNHIFFIYSIINDKLISENTFGQLFISTHNLDFLKYLKRLPGSDKKETTTKFRFLLIHRYGTGSSIRLMPEFLRKYVTEFSYLFDQVYQCANIDTHTDDNHAIVYNFGNNARKFLEVFLYYRYPGHDDHNDKMRRFFGDERIPIVLTDRITNEYSHLSGPLERGAQPIEVPEMKSAAELILNRIRVLDQDQYNSLLASIGVEVKTETEPLTAEV